LIMAYDFQPETQLTANSLGAVAVGSPEAQRASVLNLSPASAFYFIHHPDSWHIMESETGFEWSPRLKCFRLTPGVNGIRLTPGKRPRMDDRAARLRLTDQGFKIIPHEVIDGGYCWKYRGRKGAVHLDRWSVPKQVAGRTLIKVDFEGLIAFGRLLVSTGTIAPPDADVLSVLMDIKRKSIQRDSANCHIPAVAARHAENSRLLEGMQKATKDLFAPPKPAKKSKAKKAAE
jgi:hypothetical protein